MASPASALVPFGSGAGERATRARALAFLFAAGGVLVLVSLAIGVHGRAAAGVAVPGVVALVVATALARAGEAAGLRVLQAAVVGGSVLITSCVLTGGQAAGAYAALYVWVSLYAWFYFEPWAAAGQIALAGAGYAGALAIGGDAPAPGVHWLLEAGTIAVGGVLLGRLTHAIRAEAADLAAVGRLVAGQSDLDALAQETCDELLRSVGADVTLMLEPLPGGTDELRITALGGSAAAGRVFNAEGVRRGLERAFRTAAPVWLRTRPGRARLGRLRGDVHGLAQPVVRDGVAAGVLALAWTAPRRRLREGVESAATLFAAEASLALERVERQARERERSAGELDEVIVRGLVLAKQALQRADEAQALEAVDDTLGRARGLVRDQLRVVSAARGGADAGEPRVAAPPPAAR